MDRPCLDNYRKVPHMVLQISFLTLKWVLGWNYTLLLTLYVVRWIVLKITPDVNPKYVGLERSYLRDFKNVSFVDMWLL